ncbi:MAG: molybdate ABC transporter substrate-binding protein [Syntrophaceae bacterium]
MLRARILYMFLLFVFGAMPAMAEDTLKAAVAANFIAPFEELAAQYQRQTGVKVEATFTSSGKLYAQIVNGAPFDLFLSADEDRPRKLADKGLCGTPFVYAKGRVVLFTTRKDLCGAKDWLSIVTRADVKKLAVANPETAPYGAAAKKALEQTNLWETLQPRLVFPQDIAQAFQYAGTGATDAGFCALSSALTKEGAKGCYLPVPQAPAIVQSGCLLTASPHKVQSEKFTAFLNSPEALKIIQRFGYTRD